MECTGSGSGRKPPFQEYHFTKLFVVVISDDLSFKKGDDLLTLFKSFYVKNVKDVVILPACLILTIFHVVSAAAVTVVVKTQLNIFTEIAGWLKRESLKKYSYSLFKRLKP